MKCVVCDENDFQKHNSILGLEVCRSCGFIRKRTINLGKEYYQEHNVYESDLGSVPKRDARLREVKQRFAIVCRLAGPLGGKTLLEIGSHEGLFLNEALKTGMTVFGIEPNRKAAATAQQNGINVFCGTLEEFKTDRAYDVVVLFHVLEHFEDPRGALEKIYSLINPGGLLVLEVPNIASYPACKNEKNWEYINDEHVSYFSPDTIKKLLLSVGFSFGGIIQRDFDEWNVGIAENLRRIGILNAQVSMTVQNAHAIGQSKYPIRRTCSWLGIKNIVRFTLSCLVKLLRREHFMFVYAKKPL
ncbi:MAG: class I SAM-dependent methyltransferase [Patescibacteria group bacterium]